MLPLHHIRKRKTKEKSRLLDYIVYTASFLGPLTALPQLHELFVLKTHGVSALSYAGYTSLTVLWLYYGIVHKDRPIIVSNVLWLMVNGAILIGSLLS